MTTTEASKLTTGQYVDYFGSRAMVLMVRKNGVTVLYFCPRSGEQVKRRVAASYLKHL